MMVERKERHVNLNCARKEVYGEAGEAVKQS